MTNPRSGSFFLASAENQEAILRILRGDSEGEETSGVASKAQAEQILQILQEGDLGGGFGKGMARYQQPTNILEFVVEPSGTGVKISWKDPRTQYFYEDLGLADSVWVKTRVVWNTAHFPESEEDGTIIENTTADAHYVTDTTNMKDPKWVYIDADNQAPIYFRFYSYGNGEILNDAEQNRFDYDPNMKRTFVLGASQERMTTIFQSPEDFGRRLRIGLGLTNEIIEGVDVTGLDAIPTFQELLANKPYFSMVNKLDNKFQTGLVLAENEELLFQFFDAAPNVIHQVAIDALISYPSTFERAAASTTAMQAVAASTTAMPIVMANSAAWQTVADSATAMAAVADNTTAMAAVADSTTAMAAVADSATAMAAVADSTTAMAAVADSKKALKATLESTTAKKKMGNSNTALIALADSKYIREYETNTAKSGRFVAIASNHSRYTFNYSSVVPQSAYDATYNKNLEALSGTKWGATFYPFLHLLTDTIITSISSQGTNYKIYYFDLNELGGA